MAHLKRMFIVLVAAVMGLAGLIWLVTNAPAALATPGVIYVNAHAVGPTHNGTSWATAYTNLQAGLNSAVAGDEIWVAQGIYTPTQGVTRTATFALKPGVALYGGFAATETVRNQRDWTVHVTVLSGDLDGNDHTDGHGVVTATANITGNNAYHVVTGSGLTATARLDGFVITAGDATGNSLLHNNIGGGVYNASGSPTLENDTFSGNHAAYGGGGMSNDLNSTTVLINVTFSGNSCDYFGGGLYNYASSPTLTHVIFNSNSAGGGGGLANDISSPIMTDITFSANSAINGGGGMSNSTGSHPRLSHVRFSGNSAIYGGGLRNLNSSPVMTDVIFIGNTATSYAGGGIDNETSTPSLINVLISGNSANLGGGLYNYASSPNLVNVTLSSNYAYSLGISAPGQGGGLFNDGNSHPRLVNSILWGDSAETSGPEIFNADGTSSAAITYSDVQWSGSAYTGTGNIKADPLFVMPITATFAPTITGNYRLQPGSPAINAGNNLSVTVSTDLDGHPRIIGGKVDLGAYESAIRVFLPVIIRM